jgi:hypothetical protein
MSKLNRENKAGYKTFHSFPFQCDAMENKIYKVAQLSNSIRRLIDEVKDLSNDLILLNDRLQATIGIMEEKEGILILTDEEGNQMIALLDLDQEIIVDGDEDWVDLELNEIVETWENFNEVFGDELTETAKTLMTDTKAMSEEIKENVSLMNRIQEDMFELVQILRDDFGQDTEGITARLESLNESNDAATECVEDLESIQSIFPQFTDFNSMLEDILGDIETPFEESRPFPDAWI